MKKQVLIITLIFISTVILIGFFTLNYLNGEKLVDETRTVFIKKTDKGFQLFRNGSPFFIKGASGKYHLKELAEIGGNTFRVYDTINLNNVLNEAQKYNIAVIVDLPFPKYENSYFSFINKDMNRQLVRDIKNLVSKYRFHPALLMWNLGNELYYPSVLLSNSFIDIFNETLHIIHNVDPNHPICTSLASDLTRINIASIYYHSPELDLISINAFGGLKWVKYILNHRILKIFGLKPYFISEWGSDGPWESNITSWQAPIELNSTNKVEQIVDRYKLIEKIDDGACLGSLFFYWGEKQECTHTWFSLFKDDRYKSEIFKALDCIWNGKELNQNTFGIDYMIIDDKEAIDNIILPSDKVVISKIIFNKYKLLDPRIEWEIYPESWNSNGYDDEKKNIKIADSFISFKGNEAIFTSPSKEGPYRIFAYIYDNKGNYATINTPFYVIRPK